MVNNVIHDQLTSVKKKPIVIQQYDYQQMFDSMDASEACGDKYNYGVVDNHLNLIHKANKEIKINVKTPQGLSQEYKLTSRIMQGDTWASTMASAQGDVNGGAKHHVQVPGGGANSNIGSGGCHYWSLRGRI